MACKVCAKSGTRVCCAAPPSPSPLTSFYQVDMVVVDLSPPTSYHLAAEWEQRPVFPCHLTHARTKQWQRAGLVGCVKEGRTDLNRMQEYLEVGWSRDSEPRIQRSSKGKR